MHVFEGVGATRCGPMLCVLAVGPSLVGANPNPAPSVFAPNLSVFVGGPTPLLLRLEARNRYGCKLCRLILNRAEVHGPLQRLLIGRDCVLGHTRWVSLFACLSQAAPL